MSVTLNGGSIVVQPGQQVDVASLLNVTPGDNPTYLIVSLLDRNEYTAGSNGNTGTLSGNGQTASFGYIGGDSNTVGIAFTYDASTGEYTNDTYGDLANLIYTASTNTNDNTCISFFTTENYSIAYQYANSVYAQEYYAPAYTNDVGSVSVVTQPNFAGPTPSQATPNSVATAAMSFVGQPWNRMGCWILASNISAEAGASPPITSTILGVPGVPNGEWIVAYNGPAGQTGDWQSQITAGEIVLFQTSAASGHITTVVSGSGNTAMLVDNLAFAGQNGQILNAANDGSPYDILIAAPHPATQEWSVALPGSVVVYELDCPVINVTASNSTVPVGGFEQLASLFTASNPLATQTITEYQFYNSGTGAAASDSFLVGSTEQQANSGADPITVSASALLTVSFLATSTAGTDTIEVRAFNGSYWGDWQTLTLGVVAAAPTLTSQTPTQTWIRGQAL